MFIFYDDGAYEAEMEAQAQAEAEAQAAANAEGEAMAAIAEMEAHEMAIQESTKFLEANGFVVTTKNVNPTVDNYKNGMYDEMPIVQIGRFAMSMMTDQPNENRIWIKNDEGEGGEFRYEDLEPFIEEFFNKFF